MYKIVPCRFQSYAERPYISSFFEWKFTDSRSFVAKYFRFIKFYVNEQKFEQNLKFFKNKFQTTGMLLLFVNELRLACEKNNFQETEPLTSSVFQGLARYKKSKTEKKLSVTLFSNYLWLNR